MKKAKLSLAWQILIGLVLGIAIGAVLYGIETRTGIRGNGKRD